MARKPLTEKLLTLGRLIGQAKRKEPDVVKMWLDMCHANGINPSDRVLQLIAWDLQQGGVDLAEIEAKKKEDKLAEITEQAKLMEMVNR